MMNPVAPDRERRDIDEAPDMDLAVERVEVASDYCAELSVPFSSDQLAALERVAREQGVSPAQAAQRLVEQALASRTRH